MASMQLQKNVYVNSGKSVLLFGENHSPQMRCARVNELNYILSCVKTQVYLEMPMNFTVDAETRQRLVCDTCNHDVLNALRTCAVMKAGNNIHFCDPRELLGSLPFSAEEKQFASAQRANWDETATIQRFLVPILTANQLKSNFQMLLHSNQQVLDKKRVFDHFNAQSRAIWGHQEFSTKMMSAIVNKDIDNCVELYHDATDLIFELVVFSMIINSDSSRHIFYGGSAHTRTLGLLLAMAGFQ